jgi:hypothetical protein
MKFRTRSQYWLVHLGRGAECATCPDLRSLRAAGIAAAQLDPLTNQLNNTVPVPVGSIAMGSWPAEPNYSIECIDAESVFATFAACMKREWKLGKRGHASSKRCPGRTGGGGRALMPAYLGLRDLLLK